MPGISDSTLAAWRQQGFSLRGQTVVYRKCTAEARNLKTGVVTPTYTSTTLGYVLVSGAKQGEAADKVFRFRVEDLPENPPSTRSRLTYQSFDWQILSYEFDDAHIVCDLFCKRA